MNRFMFVLLHGGSLTSLLAGMAVASPEWRATGGPVGGSVFSLDLEGQVAAATTALGVHVSTDGGATWSDPARLGGGGVVGTPVAVANGVVYAGADVGIFLSSDGGATWSLMTPPLFGARLLTVRETDSGRLFANFFIDNVRTGVLFYTDDDGETWTEAPFSDPVTDVEVRGNEVLVQSSLFGFFETLSHSTDGGATWTIIGGGMDDVGGLSSFSLREAGFVGDTAIGAMANGPAILAAPGGMWQTEFFTDISGGDIWNVNWHVVGGAMYFSAYRADAGNPQPTDQWYIWRSFDGETWTRLTTDTYPAHFAQGALWAADGARVLLASDFGVYRSENHAESFALSVDGMVSTSVWAMAATDDALCANVLNGSQVWRKESSGSPWEYGRIFDNGDVGGTVLELWSPDGQSLFAGHLIDGVTRTLDGGATWEFARTGIAQYNGTAGLQYREMQAFTKTGSTLLAGSGEGLEFRSDGGQGFVTSGGGAFRSTTGGASWQRVNNGMPIIGRNSFFEPIYDPIAAMTTVGPAVLASHFFSGISRTTNAGGSWVRANTGLPLDDLGLPAMVSDFEVVGTDVYAAIQFFGGDAWGVFRSSDNGLTWSEARAGLPQISIQTLAWHNGSLYAGTGSWFLPRFPFIVPIEGVYVSHDGGASWERSGEAMAGISLRDLVVHDGVLYAATHGAGVWMLSEGCSEADLSGASDPADPAYGEPDGVLDASDFFYFLDQFAAANLGVADMTGSSDPADPTYGAPDGVLDGSDFFYFLDLFAAGCP